MTLAAQRIDRALGEPDHEHVVDALREALSRLRFGALTLTVHDGRVVQLEITEKRRFNP